MFKITGALIGRPLISNINGPIDSISENQLSVIKLSQAMTNQLTNYLRALTACVHAIEANASEMW